ncbi:DNA-deoxyinosine glycosylase [Gammaproteobacteria bacterium]|nr:DNA-deoxyinosine glycosylase [Gammaproteobacteria bacterium]
MTTARSFSAAISSPPRLLILGSMPGQRSLADQQYYAHPRNAFWPIVSQVFAIDSALPYSLRLNALTDKGVALWDVLAECERHGSLDQHIERHSERANAIEALLDAYPSIAVIACNGQAAGRLLKRHFPGLDARFEVVVLPSTSPAYAAMSLAEKTARWASALARSTPESC